MTTGQAVPDRTGFARLARGSRLVPVTRRLLADGETPVGVYRKLAGGRPGTFLLESAEHGRSWSRWSFVGVRCSATLSERDGWAVWTGTPPPGAPTDGDPLEVLAATWRALLGPAPAGELPDLPPLTVTANGRSWPATGVAMPNPHAVAVVDDLADPGELVEVPAVSPAGAFPDGVNVEFVVAKDERHLLMRVHERGVGETRSCGTGACAAAVVLAGGVPGRSVVDVPGGRLTVTIRADRHVELTGPAVVLATGELDPAALGPAAPAGGFGA